MVPGCALEPEDRRERVRSVALTRFYSPREGAGALRTPQAVRPIDHVSVRAYSGAMQIHAGRAKIAG